MNEVNNTETEKVCHNTVFQEIFNPYMESVSSRWLSTDNLPEKLAGE